VLQITVDSEVAHIIPINKTINVMPLAEGHYFRSYSY